FLWLFIFLSTFSRLSSGLSLNLYCRNQLLVLLVIYEPIFDFWVGNDFHQQPGFRHPEIEGLVPLLMAKCFAATLVPLRSTSSLPSYSNVSLSPSSEMNSQGTYFSGRTTSNFCLISLTDFKAATLISSVSSNAAPPKMRTVRTGACPLFKWAILMVPPISQGKSNCCNSL